MSEYYLGLMSGTSLDGIDAAIVDLHGDYPSICAALTQPFEPALRQALLTLAQGQASDEIEVMGSLDSRLGTCFAEAALQVIADSGLPRETIRAIGSHGQTIRHRPAAAYPFTLQIGDPNIIAERTGITTVADFRRRDIAAGGQGAPLVPAFHAHCFRTPVENRAVLNIGGMANLSILPAASDSPVSGFDTGPGNVLLDAWIHAQQGQSFDSNGAWAASGKPIPSLLERLLAEPYLAASPPKSTGRELFQLDWLMLHLQGSNAAAEDVQATLCAYTARTIAMALRTWAPATQRLLVCGGGARNRHLLALLGTELGGITVESTSAHGLEPEWIEATAFAWMARETLAARTSNLPDVTGARHRVILGGIYPAG